jgi:hypothetical protein
MNYHYFPAIFAYFRREKPLKTYLMIHFLQKKQQYFEQKNATFIWRKYFKKIITSAPLNLSVVAANVGNLASGTHPRKIGTKGVDPTSRPDVSTNRMHSHTCLKKNWYGKKTNLEVQLKRKKFRTVAAYLCLGSPLLDASPTCYLSGMIIMTCTFSASGTFREEVTQPCIGGE